MNVARAQFGTLPEAREIDDVTGRKWSGKLNNNRIKLLYKHLLVISHEADFFRDFNLFSFRKNRMIENIFAN